MPETSQRQPGAGAQYEYLTWPPVLNPLSTHDNGSVSDGPSVPHNAESFHGGLHSVVNEFGLLPEIFSFVDAGLLAAGVACIACSFLEIPYVSDTQRAGTAKQTAATCQCTMLARIDCDCKQNEVKGGGNSCASDIAILVLARIPRGDGQTCKCQNCIRTRRYRMRRRHQYCKHR
ncbi:hypothetical protein LY78DRAFT_324188 [Colletotrichum sublineola]|nr:hypothetical protein LY78DRAFT_324188 [Colletotrichum sublineola]